MLMAPYNLQYTRFFQASLPITSDTINNITVWLTYQDGKELNLRG